MATDNRFKGIEILDPANRAASMLLGYTDSYLLDASGGDATVPDDWENCRGFVVDVAGIVKIDSTKQDGNTGTRVMQTPAAGVVHQCRNVVKLYENYTGSTPGTAACYGDDGVLITNCIRLVR